MGAICSCLAGAVNKRETDAMSVAVSSRKGGAVSCLLKKIKVKNVLTSLFDDS